MATLTIEISDTMLAFIDRKVATGKYKDRSDVVQELLVLAMYDHDDEPDCYIKDGKIVFASEEQWERLEQKLEEALDEIERGECIPWNKGDCGKMGREYLKEKRSREAKHD